MFLSMLNRAAQKFFTLGLRGMCPCAPMDPPLIPNSCKYKFTSLLRFLPSLYVGVFTFSHFTTSLQAVYHVIWGYRGYSLCPGQNYFALLCFMHRSCVGLRRVRYKTRSGHPISVHWFAKNVTFDTVWTILVQINFGTYSRWIQCRVRYIKCKLFNAWKTMWNVSPCLVLLR